MLERPLIYHSYLLRIWQQDGAWHATLQDVNNGECMHFATLYELYVKLSELTNYEVHENGR